MATPLSIHSEERDAQEVVAANIRALLGRNRLHQRDLAQGIGISTRRMSECLAAKRPFNVRELDAIARFFGKAMGDLVTLGKHAKPELELIPGAKRKDTGRPPRSLLVQSVR